MDADFVIAAPNEYDLYFLSVKNDEASARQLAESIRSYRLPGNVKALDSTLDYRRIRLDCADAPLDDEERRALEHSRYLCLLCSPDTREDPGILERLNLFRRAHGQDFVIAVLLRGEPAEALPEGFIEKKLVRHILPDMSVVERMETIEPIVADLRAGSPARLREMLRYETVRIIASVLGMHPDELEQRQRQRRKKAVTMLVSVIAAVCAAAAGIFLYLGSIARNEGNIAAQQTALSIEVAQRTMDSLPASFAGDEQALAYIDEAVASARDALSELGLSELLDDGGAGNGG